MNHTLHYYTDQLNVESSGNTASYPDHEVGLCPQILSSMNNIDDYMDVSMHPQIK